MGPSYNWFAIIVNPKHNLHHRNYSTLFIKPLRGFRVQIPVYDMPVSGIELILIEHGFHCEIEEEKEE